MERVHGYDLVSTLPFLVPFMFLMTLGHVQYGLLS
jgi:hypothetical protein